MACLLVIRLSSWLPWTKAPQVPSLGWAGMGWPQLLSRALLASRWQASYTASLPSRQGVSLGTHSAHGLSSLPALLLPTPPPFTVSRTSLFSSATHFTTRKCSQRPVPTRPLASPCPSAQSLTEQRERPCQLVPEQRRLGGCPVGSGCCSPSSQEHGSRGHGKWWQRLSHHPANHAQPFCFPLPMLLTLEGRF